jgi:hypothetical protein
LYVIIGTERVPSTAKPTAYGIEEIGYGDVVVVVASKSEKSMHVEILSALSKVKSANEFVI